MVAFTVVGIAVVVIVFQKEVLVRAVAGERNGRDTQAREDVLESVNSAEGAGVSPRLTAGLVSSSRPWEYGQMYRTIGPRDPS